MDDLGDDEDLSEGEEQGDGGNSSDGEEQGEGVEDLRSKEGIEDKEGNDQRTADLLASVLERCLHLITLEIENLFWIHTSIVERTSRSSFP